MIGVIFLKVKRDSQKMIGFYNLKNDQSKKRYWGYIELLTLRDKENNIYEIDNNNIVEYLAEIDSAILETNVINDRKAFAFIVPKSGETLDQYLKTQNKIR